MRTSDPQCETYLLFVPPWHTNTETRKVQITQDTCAHHRQTRLYPIPASVDPSGDPSNATRQPDFMGTANIESTAPVTDDP